MRSLTLWTSPRMVLATFLLDAVRDTLETNTPRKLITKLKIALYDFLSIKEQNKIVTVRNLVYFFVFLKHTISGFQWTQTSRHQIYLIY